MEYAGYKGLTEGIDLAGLTDKLATKVSDIGKDRVKRKEELDTLASESAKKLSEIEMTKTESLNEKLLALGDEGRNKIAEWNSQLKAGNLSPSEYKKRMAGITEYTSLVGSTAKNFDAQMQEYIKRQADKTGSAYELATMEMYGKMADIKNTQYKVLDDGRIAIGLTDPETGKIINQKDLRVINKSENMMTPRMNLNSEVNSVVKNWGADGIITYLGRGGYKSSASAANDPKFGLAKKRVVQALVTQNAISLLVDNGGLSYVDYAFSESDKDKKISQAVKEAADLKGSALTKEEISDIETGMILVGNDGKPVLTDAQLEKARKIAEAEIDLQVDNELKTVAPQPVSSGGGGSYGYNGPEGLKKFVPGMYDRLAEAWELSKGGKDGAEASANAFSALSGGDYKFKWTKDGLVAYTETQLMNRNGEGQYQDILTADGKPTGKKRPLMVQNTVATSKNLVDFAPLFYGEGTLAGGEDIAIAEFNQDKALSKRNKPTTKTNPNDRLNLGL